MNTNQSPSDAVAPEPLQEHRLKKLLTRRQALSTVAIEHLSHDLPGAELLFQAVHQVEEHLRQEFPTVWAQSSADWVTTEAALLHSPDQPAPASCWLCRQRYVPGVEIRSAS